MNTATATKVKTKPNLTSVTPHPVAPETAPIDTTTPIDVSVIAFTQRDMPKWGPWMLSRLSEHWPHFTHITYGSYLLQHMVQNSSLLIRARKAIVLAVVTRETFEPRPIVDLVFCFKHHPGDEEEEKDVRLLYRRMEEWAKGHGAKYVRILRQDHIDSTPSRTKDNLWADEGKILLKDLDK